MTYVALFIFLLDSSQQFSDFFKENMIKEYFKENMC